jgi:transposase
MYSEQKLADDPSWFKTLFIDTTLIKNLAGTDCVGKNPTDRGRLGSKISMLCDRDRIPVSCVLYPANKGDCRTVEDTVNAVSCHLTHDKRRTSHVVGDKAYSSQAILSFLCAKRMRRIAESKKNSKHKIKLTASDKRKLRQRHVVENLFCRLKQFKRVRHRMDRLVSAYEAGVHVAMCIMLLSKIQDL